MSKKEEPSEKTTVIGKRLYEGLFRSHSIAVGGVLLCTQGPHEGLQVPLDKEVLVVGRALWSDIPLPNDPKVSRLHCELILSEGGIKVRDMASQNGTFVNNTRIFEAPLEQSFQVGDSLFTLEGDGSPQSVDIKYYDQSGSLVGQSMKMRKIFSMLSRLGQSDVSVILRGETGTGKSCVAKALHEQSGRAAHSFLTVNCGALSPSLVEASLFGYEKGAFTGALRQHPGFFEQAHKGTLFLDEIGELPLELQPKLLDVVERRMLHRLGGAKEIEVDVRLITATHTDMEEQLAQKSFREDLYHRLAVAELEIPPLRERMGDIPLLAEYLLYQIQSQETPSLSADALESLCRFSWPGNIRQLRNVLERSLVFLEGHVIGREDLLLPQMAEDSEEELDALTSLSEGSLKEQLQVEEKRILDQVLEETGWDIPLLTERLGVSRASLYNRFQKLGIKRP